MLEVWVQSTSLPQYECSSHGRIRRIPHFGRMPHGGLRKYGGKAWTGAWDSDQQRFVVQHRRKTFRVAWLVCEAFHGLPFKGAVAMHKDEQSWNNSPDNLCWETQKANLNCPDFLQYAARVCVQKMAGLRI